MAAERGAASWEFLDNDRNLDLKAFKGITSMGNLIECDEAAMTRVFEAGTISALDEEVRAKKSKGGE